MYILQHLLSDCPDSLNIPHYSVVFIYDTVLLKEI